MSIYYVSERVLSQNVRCWPSDAFGHAGGLGCLRFGMSSKHMDRLT